MTIIVYSRNMAEAEELGRTCGMHERSRLQLAAAASGCSCPSASLLHNRRHWSVGQAEDHDRAVQPGGERQGTTEQCNHANSAFGACFRAMNPW